MYLFTDRWAAPAARVVPLPRWVLAAAECDACVGREAEARRDAAELDDDLRRRGGVRSDEARRDDPDHADAQGRPRSAEASS